tara:strand:- start:1199 stop:1984 length:786 start_codon:yes stop_codon:yes gene_type:complete
MSGKDYITPALSGRLGNQMFMVAQAYARSLDQNRQLKIGRKQLQYEGHEYDTNIFRKFDFIPDYNLRNKDAIVFGGYFQSEKHFEDHADAVREKYSPPESFVSKVKEELPIISDKIVTVINVRKGDYLMFPNYHPTVTPEFIYEALAAVPYTEHILVASDDLDWCRKNLEFSIPTTYLEGWKSHEQLWIMSMCHNFVISNSSFSWWAAYLSTYKKKTVVAPQTWFGPEHQGGWDDMYCKDWIVYPSYFENGFIYPDILRVS